MYITLYSLFIVYNIKIIFMIEIQEITVDDYQNQLLANEIHDPWTCIYMYMEQITEHMYMYSYNTLLT